ncbi:MAG: pseudouridine-5'-phosphate glycosidase [Chloroflexota bacterium]
MNASFAVLPEVAAALAAKQPIVALESTVITHGLPYPANVETAVAMETAVRDGGATPATIAIIQGRIHIGLTADQIEYLATRNRDNVRKCSRRDLPLVVAQRWDGATTVAGTMILAHAAGIQLFATGGIGGVHRGHPFDVSADLAELSRTPVAVVCSGAKSILDLPATREVLETNGVPVIGYGTDEMPAFYTWHSGLPVDLRLDAPADVAALIHAQQQLHLQNGMLITVPAPQAAVLDSAEMETYIAQATAEADAQGIHGAAATPWLLSRLVELTNGRSL